MNWKGCGRTQVLSKFEILLQQSPEMTEINHENSLSGWPMSRPRLQPNMCGKQIRSLLTEPSSLVSVLLIITPYVILTTWHILHYILVALRGPST
jgi:hypothetical protein